MSTNEVKPGGVLIFLWGYLSVIFTNRKGAVLRAAPSSELIVVVVKRNILQHALRFINVNIGDGWQVIGAMPVAFVFHA